MTISETTDHYFEVYGALYLSKILIKFIKTILEYTTIYKNSILHVALTFPNFVVFQSVIFAKTVPVQLATNAVMKPMIMVVIVAKELILINYISEHHSLCKNTY